MQKLIIWQGIFEVNPSILMGHIHILSIGLKTSLQLRLMWGGGCHEKETSVICI